LKKKEAFYKNTNSGSATNATLAWQRGADEVMQEVGLSLLT